MKTLVKPRMKHRRFFGLSKKKRVLLLALGLSLYSGSALAAGEDDFKTAEYYFSNGLDVINAAAAYNKGYSGRGVALGVCDLPTNFAHPEFTSKNFARMIRDSWMPGGEPGVYDWSTVSHGTHVAGIVGASKDNVGMHGVAYNADLVGAPSGYDIVGNSFTDFADVFAPYYDRDDIKVINNSWGDDRYIEHSFNKNVEHILKDAQNLNDFIVQFKDFLSSTEQALSHGLQRMGDATAHGKLLVFSAANSGHPTPSYEAFTGWSYNTAQTNLINVTALNNNGDKYTRGMSRQADGTISGDWLMSYFSNGAKYAEEYTLTAPGFFIISTNSDFAATGENYIDESGTSMAAPFVTGVAGLVQEAFPYMSGKQIGDTLLSTANNNITVNKDYFVTIQMDSDGKRYNVFYFDGNTRTAEQIQSDIGAYFVDLPTVYGELDEVPVAYYNVPLQAFIGQGVVDAGKAVNGPGALNARRLASADVTDAYSADGTKTVMYSIDTKGYDSTWSNDIKEIKVGKIAADSAEADLAERYKYYDTNWLSNDNAETGAALLTALYVDEYNSNVDESGMEGLHVGLIKNGEGRLSLTGNNTYEGASVAKGGTLSIDGSLVGDAYSVDSGTIAGRGTIGGTLYNRNIAVAGDSTASGNLTMQNLVSTGTLVSHVTAKDNSRFIVHNTADVTGSTVLLNNALPNESRTVVAAGTLTGNVANTVDKPLATTGMLSTYGTTTGNTLTATAVAANNLGAMDGRQSETYNAMNNMYQNLDTARREEMRTLYNLSADGAKSALTEIESSGAGDIMHLTQTSTVADRIISDRLNTDFSQGNDAWVKFTKNWGDLRSDANYHGSAISGGYDKSFGKNTRGGLFVTYNTVNLGGDNSSADIYDTRFGIYGIYRQGAREAYWYADYGWQNNKLRRSIPTLGLGTKAKYRSNLFELGGEYKYDLHADDGKIWHVSPYADMQFSYLHQNGYNEQGAGIFNQQVSSKNNAYLAMGVGLELKRYLGGGSYAMRLGVKHALAGADPNLTFNYEGDNSHSYNLQNNQDKTHFILKLSGETEFAKGWQVAGDALMQKGAHDKDLSVNLTLRRLW